MTNVCTKQWTYLVNFMLKQYFSITQAIIILNLNLANLNREKVLSFYLQTKQLQDGYFNYANITFSSSNIKKYNLLL